MSAEHRQFIRRIRTANESMLRLVNDLLDVSRIEAGKLVLRRGPVDLRELVGQNVAVHRLLAAKKQIEVSFPAWPDEPLRLEADGPKLEQVLSYLIANALKFSPPGARVEVGVVRDGAQVVVSVRDHGPGIPASEVGKLFAFFQKTSVQSPGGESSSGLGLGIARKIVEGHGGAIRVETREGLGSTFSFSLPLDAAASLPA